MSATGDKRGARRGQKANVGVWGMSAERCPIAMRLLGVCECFDHMMHVLGVPKPRPRQS